MAYTEDELKKELETKDYEYGFYTDIDSETFPVGLNEDIIDCILEIGGLLLIHAHMLVTLTSDKFLRD